ncbi:unnamed protein product [Phaedon cochleariae]|uniref:Uncharacterized protein n=1 Tax=Phaedon cochleariae TaxID=80249 RepID=A0A9N9X2L5_PHACE|nr:unnamed protein product [Phaedon cochleariae]
MFEANSTSDSQGKVPPDIPPVESRMPEIVFRQRTIRRILLGLKTNRANGPDGVPPIILKKCSPELTPFLCKLFSVSYRMRWASLILAIKMFPSNGTILSLICLENPLGSRGFFDIMYSLDTHFDRGTSNQSPVLPESSVGPLVATKDHVMVTCRC